MSKWGNDCWNKELTKLKEWIKIRKVQCKQSNRLGWNCASVPSKCGWLDAWAGPDRKQYFARWNQWSAFRG